MNIDYVHYEDDFFLEAHIPLPLFVNNDLGYDYPRQIDRFSESDHKMCTAPNETGFGADEEIEFTVNCDNSQTEPSQDQQTAIDYLFSNVKTIENIILNHFKKTFQLFNEEVESRYTNEDLVRVSKCLSFLQNDDNINRTFVLTSINILREKEATKSCIALNFNSSWEREHGISVMMCENKILAQGSSSEFHND